MIEVKITYFPPCEMQGIEGPVSISKRIPVDALRDSISGGIVKTTAEDLYQIILANSALLQGELE